MKINYNYPKIEKLLYSIKDLCGVQLFFLSADGVCRCGTLLGKDCFCDKIEGIPNLNKNCIACNEELIRRCTESHKTEWHFCHAGLFDAFMPILKEGILVGYLQFGHMRTDGSTCPDSIDNQELQALYQQQPYLPLDMLKSFSVFLSNINFGDYLWINEDETSAEQFEKYFEDQIHQYVERNLDKDLSVSALCEYFHISKAFFYKKWGKSNHPDFAEFVLKKRINTAKKMIRETTLPIYQIAERIGLRSYSSFFKAFQKHFGMTPTQYREKTR